MLEMTYTLGKKRVWNETECELECHGANTHFSLLGPTFKNKGASATQEIHFLLKGLGCKMDAHLLSGRIWVYGLSLMLSHISMVGSHDHPFGVMGSELGRSRNSSAVGLAVLLRKAAGINQTEIHNDMTSSGYDNQKDLIRISD